MLQNKWHHSKKNKIELRILHNFELIIIWENYSRIGTLSVIHALNVTF